jgi:hypothetical protein
MAASESPEVTRVYVALGRIIAGLAALYNPLVLEHQRIDIFSAADLLRLKPVGEAYIRATHNELPATFCRCDACGGHFAIPGSAFSCGDCLQRGCTH